MLPARGRQILGTYRWETAIALRVDLRLGDTKAKGIVADTFGTADPDTICNPPCAGTALAAGERSSHPVRRPEGQKYTRCAASCVIASDYDCRRQYTDAKCYAAEKAS